MNLKTNRDEHEILRRSINEMLGSGAIELCEEVDGQFLSTYFLVPKSDGSSRFVLNLKNLNCFMNPEHFKIEDIRTVVNVLCKYDYMGKIDLKDAFFLIPIHESSRKYLRFVFEGKFYQFLVLPFGLCTCPYVFTKVMKVVIFFLRAKGYRSTIYLDDMCLFGQSKEACSRNIHETSKLLMSLGFIINRTKSQLEPKKECTFLGFVLDSENMLIKLTEKKKAKIFKMVRRFINLRSCKIRELAEVIGVLVAACPAVKYGWLYYKELEKIKYLAMLKYKKDMERVTQLSDAAHSDLKWWEKRILKSSCNIRSFSFKREIFSDASTSGWGAVCAGEKAHGFWDREERKMHINLLELTAAFLALRCFAGNDRNCQILLRIDNITAIAYINKLGGVKFPHLNEVTKQIWEWCIERDIWIFAEYVASRDNIADSESRITNIDTEWELADHVFESIVRKFGQPEIDLFATRSNAKCDTYCSWQRDPDALAINAFTTSWSARYWYAFPPFALITKILKKIRDDNAKGILVVPLWPGQPWYPEFKRLLVGHLLEFKPSNRLLLSPCRKVTHPLTSQLSLIAGVLSGRRMDEKD